MPTSFRQIGARDKRKAREHLDLSIGEFLEMKMHPLLGRAQRDKEILEA